MSEKINMSELITLLADKSNISKKEAELFLKEYFNVIGEGLIKDQLVKVKDLGTFKLVSVSPRESVDVNDGTRVVIPAHFKVNYTPDNQLAKDVNEPFALFESVEINDRVMEVDDIALAERPLEAVLEVISEVIIDEEIPPVIKDESLTEKSFGNEYQFYKDFNKQRQSKNTFRTNITFALPILGIILLLALLTAGYFYLENDTEYTEYTEYLALSDYYEQQPYKKDLDIDTDFIPFDTTEIAKDDKLDSVLIIHPEVSTKTVREESIDTFPKRRTVEEGERLTLIALQEYGHKSFWVYLYEENKNIIRDPNNVKTGTKLIIPSASKYGIDKNNPEAIEKANTLMEKYLN